MGYIFKRNVPAGAQAIKVKRIIEYSKILN